MGQLEGCRMTADTLSWGPIKTRFGAFAAWVDARGRLIRFWLNTKDAASYDRSARRDDDAIAHVAREVDEYCAGTRRRFTLELAAWGTPFQHRVWDALVKIPYGETTSYGALAKHIGSPGAARAVGLANGSNPIGLIVPCHRVIGADGSLTGYGGGLPLKRALLAFESENAERSADLFAMRSG
jgi:methylated-DNA-[protein]-cysteine S-methyltransferase